MNRKLKCCSLLGILLLLMLLDGLLTYINTPDLAREANPLVTVFGLGWGALFTANLIAFILLFLLAWQAFVKYDTLVAPAENRREYLSQLYFGRPDKFIWTLYKLPKKWGPVFAMFGYVFLFSMMLARVILVFEWLTVDVRVPVYDDLRRMAPYGRLDIVLALLFAVYLIFRWIDMEYKKSQGLAAVTEGMEIPGND